MAEHLNIHVEIQKARTWHHYQAAQIKYADDITASLIGGLALAYARRRHPDIQDMASLHGIPDDVSEVTRYCLAQDKEEGPVKNTCALTEDDIRAVDLNLTDYGLDRVSRRIHTDLDSLCRRWPKIRLVCWYTCE